MICTLCNSKLTIRLGQKYFACQTCDAKLMDSKFWSSKKEEKKHYESHNNDIDDPRYQKFTSPISNYVLKNFTTDSLGLDFGSGTGPVISKVLQDLGYRICQYDPFFAVDPAALQNQYDYIVSCEVIEHFYKPQKEFETFKKLLKPYGKLICMTLLYKEGVDFENWYYKNDPTHVFFYSEKTVEFIKNKFKFESYEIYSDRMVVWET
ncbi:class I SAM-dependent methyltransferase [Aquiflexum lacus]|uniref:class I SAM-dependent methyltransferase n=1 Tax=Aquiflexum lacus TaxID=2483805 RepID=UPI001E30321B|nr:class I SAM-dependent methyltransferase [Aquiflexum lacus]